MCRFSASQLPAAAASAVPDLAQLQVNTHAVGCRAVAGGTSCPATLPPELSSAVSHPASGSQSTWTNNQLGKACTGQPITFQQGSASTAAASNASDSVAISPAAAPQAQHSAWMTSGCNISGERQLLPESAAHVVLDISGSLWDQEIDLEAANASSESDGAPTAQSSDQNLGCMPPPSGQKFRRVHQKHSLSLGDSCSGPPWQLEPSGRRCCSNDRLIADNLPGRAHSTESVLSFEALATRSHTSGLDLSTVCWLISGDPD